MIQLKDQMIEIYKKMQHCILNTDLAHFEITMEDFREPDRTRYSEIIVKRDKCKLVIVLNDTINVFLMDINMLYKNNAIIQAYFTIEEPYTNNQTDNMILDLYRYDFVKNLVGMDGPDKAKGLYAIVNKILSNKVYKLESKFVDAAETFDRIQIVK